MKTKISLLLAMAIVAITFNECKKYPDGPGLSLRSKTARMTDNWKISSYKINGVDELAPYTETMTYTISNFSCSNVGQDVTYTYSESLSNFTMDIAKGGTVTTSITESITDIDGTATNAACAAKTKTTTLTSASAGTWAFASGKKQVIVTTTGTSSSTTTYDILELKEKEMKWKGTVTISGVAYLEEYTFTKQ
ncbi:MAG: hypothetical protein HY063_10525 [Bacteroidetes bacterium]|nr:hypothetical protein [Bacteroidota bacterium]